MRDYAVGIASGAIAVSILGPLLVAAAEYGLGGPGWGFWAARAGQAFRLVAAVARLWRMG